MQMILRTLRSLVVATVAAALLTPAYANPFLDWAVDDFISRSQPQGPSYWELREEFFAKIRKAEADVRACGGCADAQVELDALLAEEVDKAFEEQERL